MKTPNLNTLMSSQLFSHVFTATKQSFNACRSLFSPIKHTPKSFNLFSKSHLKDNFKLASKEMKESIKAVERIVGYQFKNQELLEEALTHSSYTGTTSYQRLEFLGDSALGCALSNYVFLAYPDLDPGRLTLICSANISTEKLARVAMKHGFYQYVRHNAAVLDEKVREFAIAIQDEKDVVTYGGSLKAPKILADIVESVAAAIYVDSNFDLHVLWTIFSGLLEPIVMLDDLQLQPQPVTTLFQMCQKEGKQVDIKHWRKGLKNIAHVYVDGKFVASSHNEQKDTAKLCVAKEALQKLEHSKMKEENNVKFNGAFEIVGAKQRLHEVCRNKNWPKPSYKIEEVGPANERKYKCSVRIEASRSKHFVLGDMKSTVKDAENWAASDMLQGLEEYL